MRKISPEFNSLFWTQFYGALNDNFFKSALVILIAYKNVSLFGVPSASMVALCGGVFGSYQPRHHSLYLLSCGERYAVASWGRWSCEGRWVWRWKNYIDKSFIKRFSESSLM